MLGVLELFYFGVTMANQTLNVIAFTEQDVKKVEGSRVVAVQMRGSAPMWSDNFCRYKGVMVEYTRDWDEIDSFTGEVKFKADPDTYVAYGLILTEETCPKTGTNPVLLTGAKPFPLSIVPWGKDIAIRAKLGVTAVNYGSQLPEMRPKWLPQVIRTLHAEADSNPTAKSYLASVMTHFKPTAPAIPPVQESATIEVAKTAATEEAAPAVVDEAGQPATAEDQDKAK